MNNYIGHPAQIYGVEEVRLVGGRGDGMRLFEVRNATGLAFTVSADRCADIVRLSLNGTNYGYFAACGFVAPAYYDHVGAGFLKSFTAGFMTTCGLRAVGSPCVDEGEELPLHGTVSHIPCENIYHFIENDEIHIRATVRDARLFGDKLLLEREYICPLYENTIRMCDTIRNIGSADCPLEVLYHCNLGYPLLDENLQLSIPSTGVEARNAHAQSGIADWAKMEKPQRGYEEMCFYHKMQGKTTVKAKNPVKNKALAISYDTAELPFFTEWKMMGEGDYVLGLEPGNCEPDGRDVMRKQGKLEILAPGAEKHHHITFTMTEE